MGTGGQYAYRYRRRYYTTYSTCDSYPSVLGQSLIDKIPTDPTAFKEWAEKLKAGLGKRGHPENPSYDSFSMRAPTLDLCTEWTYVIDLDRNVYTVNEGFHLRLDAIPRDNKGPLGESHPARVLTLSPTVPPPEPRYLALYDGENATQTLSPLSETESFPFPTCGVLMDYFFRQLRFAYSPVLDQIEQYEPDHPDFQALAQAVLALATWGDFCMDYNAFQHCNSYYEARCTTIKPEWSDTTMQDADTHFWHMSTLVILDIGLDDEQRLRSALGRAIELWRAKSRPEKSATAFIISLKSVVVVRFSGGTVSHSTPIELCGGITESQPLFLPFSHTPGFDLLKRHFTPALPAVEAALQLALPIDVMERILDMCDDATLQTLRQTCKTVRTLCLVRPCFRVGDYRLLYHVADDEFTALDPDGVSTPVVMGKVGCAMRESLPGGQGHNLILHTKDAHHAVVGLMGLRCVSKAQFGADAAKLIENPETDWRRKRLSEDSDSD